MKKLSELTHAQQYHFTATVQRYGRKNAQADAGRHYTKVVTICLQDITLDGDVMADHTWTVFTAPLRKFGQLRPGDVIEFDATVSTYTKGYRGKNRRLQRRYPISKDACLIDFANVTLLTKPFEARRALPATEFALIRRLGDTPENLKGLLA